MDDDQLRRTGFTSLHQKPKRCRCLPSGLIAPSQLLGELAPHFCMAVLVRSGFDFSLFVGLVMGLYRGCFSLLAARAVTSVGTANEDSQKHDRDDHSATDVCRVRKFMPMTLTAFSGQGHVICYQVSTHRIRLERWISQSQR